MRVLLSAVWVLLLAVAGHATPAPPPPPGFSGGQYVDGRGCVWWRDGGDWQRRLDNAGALVCGFPPTGSARRTDPDSERVLPPEFAAPSPSPGDLLAAQLSAGLRQGELLDDPRAMEPRLTPDMPAGTDPVAAQLGAFARHEASLRNALSGGGAAGSDLCRLLGYVPEMANAPVLGGDVTQGMCPGMRAPKPEERISEGAVAPVGVATATNTPAATARNSSGPGPQVKSATTTAATSAVPDAAMRPAARSRAAETATRAEPAKASAAAAGVAVRRTGPRATAAPATAPATVEMIPASARYVQVGGFRDDGNAQIAIRRLSAMGYRVAQAPAQTGGAKLRVILAGPFTDRQALVAALNRLRAEGYPKATAR